MKKIGIDARLYFHTGVGVYIRNLIHYLETIPSKDIQYYIYVLKEDSNKINFSAQNFIKRPVNYKWHSFGEQIGYCSALLKDSLDLMHFTYFSHPVLYRRKYIATVHDTILASFKTGKASTKNRILYEMKYLGYKIAYNNLINTSQIIITPSRTVKNELLRMYGHQVGNKIVNIYEGVDYLLLQSKQNRSLRSKFPNPFFLYVGNFYPHKNVERLIEAFAAIQFKEKVDLILRGPKDFFAERILRMIKILQAEDRIKLFEQYSPEDMTFLYGNALALIHPSLSEGFGLPVIEAVHNNLPVIASNIEIFKELLGSRYLSFNPNDKESMEKAISTFYEKRESFDYAGIMDKFSFKSMAEKTQKIYDTLTI